MREIQFRAYVTGSNGSFVTLINNEEIDDCIERGEPVMQYTGLKDKNGKEIYEGDIVEYHWVEKHAPCEVAWNEERAQFGFRDKGDPTIYGVNLHDVDRRAQVIGNIHENPELLS